MDKIDANSMLKNVIFFYVTLEYISELVSNFYNYENFPNFNWFYRTISIFKYMYIDHQS